MEIQWYHPYFFMSFTSLASFVDICYRFQSLSLSGFKLMFASEGLDVWREDTG